MVNIVNYNRGRHSTLREPTIFIHMGLSDSVERGRKGENADRAMVGWHSMRTGGSPSYIFQGIRSLLQGFTQVKCSFKHNNGEKQSASFSLFSTTFG